MRLPAEVHRIVRAAARFIALVLAFMAHPALAAGDWNDREIAWQPYAEGLRAAEQRQMPVCLIFYTEWCPHCANHSRVFHDPRVVEVSKNFVMIRLDRDKNEELSARYAPDGEYIPRTYFLSSAGVLDPELHEEREDHAYFYSEYDPVSILAGMERALAKRSTGTRQITAVTRPSEESGSGYMGWVAFGTLGLVAVLGGNLLGSWIRRRMVLDAPRS